MYLKQDDETRMSLRHPNVFEASECLQDIRMSLRHPHVFEASENQKININN